MGAAPHRKARHLDGSTDDSWHTYVCGHCGTKVAGAILASLGGEDVLWLLCPECNKGSTYSNYRYYPGLAFGPQIDGLPDPVSEAYGEARACMSVNAFTAAELICRKILMHVAVDKGAKEGDPFASYLDFLEKQGYITPPMKGWVDLIRQHGNKSTHRLQSPDQERAESTVMLTAELLRIIYEMQHMANKYTIKKPTKGKK